MKRNGNIDIFALHPTQILVLGFAILILIGALLLNLPIASQNGQSIGFINALFTATSAVCVTGLVVVDTLTYWTTFGQVVIILLIQIGGLGFMTMGTLFALLLGKKITLRERLVMQEALNQFSFSGVVRLAKYILIMTFTIEGIGAILLSIKFIPIYGLSRGIWYSIFHSISAFCNAGFDLIGNFRSLTPFVDDVLINMVIMSLIILGGIGFVVILDVMQKKNFNKLSLHSKLAITMTLILISVGFFVILILEFYNPDTMGQLSLKGKFLSALFHSVTPRTAGFNTLPTDKLTMASIFFTIVLMFIGGSSAGTAGGVKITTTGVVIATIVSVIKGKDDTETFGRRIPRDIINRSLAIIGLALGLVILVTMILSITEKDCSFIGIFFEAVSAFGTVGLSLGVTSTLSKLGKIIIAITMFFGRVGPLTVLLALAQRKKENKGILRYPEEKVIVG
ncbi:trk system potassium uptake protein TrkH [Caminicella sporogenes DSM 14501]|uniref:Trk system potassium uptake protein TrkH n=1 Tax=Caminicella sporogenes DSM 14501 TaxID=1121266 RepID=A0A1M6QTB6_9FIRM|nr:TrkH family potassium uptake protein [Caminicella sporogenes]RKD20920.1 Trk family potassium uptake protein [Caminicella sporogenes]SHK23405.1 trk system potassium uptake protein TrkH [Caminicella sporogenes DSM 14501]